ncbi:hypothetical protein [Flagellimonas allohymeniacidonis]|uniref:Type II secretion system protein GspC N-terminal domain-containing protein n=1 Tax=Flagellimonas allohymeniacidonis TaxID=2517819 RepID=A0A4Q8QJ60_9FLAO|nr:hypothetical protein [Allomuricauda hymeniacidonis]TAI48499.1 hypothetical protein EW142_01455 [Allomuricauda hymeniacidonis]
MGKNIKTYILLGVVLIIWGVIAYRIFATLSPEPQKQNSFVAKSYAPMEMAARDTFSIKADYRDPFLGTLTSSKPKKTPQAKVVKREIPSIDVRYTGSMYNSSTKKRIYFVTINGQQHLLEKGRSVAKITLVRGSEGSITYRYHGVLKKVSLTP